jgi:hypothetical protein
MILGFKASPEGNYWFGKVNGLEKKFVRVIAGLMMGHLDRQVNAIVVLAELYRSISPPDISAIAATTGNWAQVKAALLKYREHTQFDHIIVENQGMSDTLTRNMPELRAMNNPCIVFHAPAHATTELGRQTVDALIGEGRLHLEEVQNELRHEPEQGAKAIQLAVTYMLEFTSIYPNAKKKTQPVYQKVWGQTGL